MVRVTTMTPSQSNLEDTLCWRARLRILRLLTEAQTLNTSQIASKVGVNYVLTRAHLEALENCDVLCHASFGKKIRYYRFKESPRANAVKNLIEAWRQPENQA